MNGAHDMGGMQGFGPIVQEENEPIFHEPWEGRVMALRRILGAAGKLPPALRPAIESIPPPEYLRIGYYEKWYLAVIELLVAGGIVTREELESGKAEKSPADAPAPLTPAEAVRVPFRLPDVMLQTEAAPRYTIGQQIRTRKINPIGHTRLPRYARGRIGSIVRHQGVQALPDTHVYGLGVNPQHVYTVRFTARELWGNEASARDSVCLDLWEDYLESA